MSTCGRNKAVDPRILIVGAGPAGIAAASKLFENGFKNVTILEAENRIGGRINTTKLGEYNVDLGGQWVHGEKGNVAYDLAYPLGLLHKINTSETSLAQKYLDSLGNPIKDDIAENISNFYNNYVDDPALDDNAPCDSIGEYAEKMFDVQFKDSQEIYDQKQKYLRYLELVKIGMESTESWYNLPITGVDDYANYPGDSMMNWKDRGFSTILDILMKKIPDPKKELPVSANTYLNSEVISIDYSKNNREKSILITTTDGRIYNADHVIVTIPLGVLKEKHKSMFVPPLPDNKVKTIEGLGYGNVAKVYLLFEKPFWKLHGERILQFTLMWNDAEKKEIESDSEKSWVLGVTSIQSIEHKPNLLMLWITGKYARAMEALPEDKVFNHAGELLHRFLNKIFNVTQPIGMVRTQWITNTHFKGTYSYYSIEAKKHEVDAETLAEPVYPENLNLLFAGEATSKQRYGTADGAIVSGFRAAEEVLKHYRNIEK